MRFAAGPLEDEDDDCASQDPKMDPKNPPSRQNSPCTKHLQFRPQNMSTRTATPALHSRGGRTTRRANGRAQPPDADSQSRLSPQNGPPLKCSSAAGGWWRCQARRLSLLARTGARCWVDAGSMPGRCTPTPRRSPDHERAVGIAFPSLSQRVVSAAGCDRGVCGRASEACVGKRGSQVAGR
jgi:hypothetical protein